MIIVHNGDKVRATERLKRANYQPDDISTKRKRTIPMDVKSENNDIPKQWDRRGLPGWCYHSPALLELEKKHIFTTHWQIACHISDIPDAGSYITFDLFKERAIILRNNDFEVPRLS